MFYYANGGLKTLISRARGGEENICSQLPYLIYFYKIQKQAFLIFHYQKMLVTKSSQHQMKGDIICFHMSGHTFLQLNQCLRYGLICIQKSIVIEIIIILIQPSSKVKISIKTTSKHQILYKHLLNRFHSIKQL